MDGSRHQPGPGALPPGQGRVEDYNASEDSTRRQHRGTMPPVARAQQQQQQQQQQQRRGSFSHDGFMDDGFGGGPADMLSASQRGSQASLASAASDRTAGTGSSARQNDSAVKMAVRAAAAQVQALQSESRSRQRAQTPPAGGMGSRRPNVEVRATSPRRDRWSTAVSIFTLRC